MEDLEMHCLRKMEFKIRTYYIGMWMTYF